MVPRWRPTLCQMHRLKLLKRQMSKGKQTMRINDVISLFAALIGTTATLLGAWAYIRSKHPTKKEVFRASLAITIIMITILGFAVAISHATTIKVNGQEPIPVPAFLAPGLPASGTTTPAPVPASTPTFSPTHSSASTPTLSSTPSSESTSTLSPTSSPASTPILSPTSSPVSTSTRVPRKG